MYINAVFFIICKHAYLSSIIRLAEIFFEYIYTITIVHTSVLILFFFFVSFSLFNKLHTCTNYPNVSILNRDNA